MKKNILLDLYINYIENIIKSKDKNKTIKIWNFIKNHNIILEYASSVNENNFNSNIIVDMILNDKELFDTTIYSNLIEIIYKNKLLARKKVLSSKSFLMLTLLNENLNLTKEQKIFLIYEAEECPNTEKSYRDGIEKQNIHGMGIIDIRFKLLTNRNFSLQEKKNIFNLCYPDDDIKIVVLEELRCYIIKKLHYYNNTDYNDIDNIELDTIPFNSDKEKEFFVNLIELYNYIEKNISKEVIKKYINND